jgi:hypothetical protein
VTVTKPTHPGPPSPDEQVSPLADRAADASV